jgi:hypothetical protein
MSEILRKKLDGFPTYKVDTTKNTVLNLKSANTVNFDDFFEISHILDSSYFNYKVDHNLNIILLGKK